MRSRRSHCVCGFGAAYSRINVWVDFQYFNSRCRDTTARLSAVAHLVGNSSSHFGSVPFFQNSSGSSEKLAPLIVSLSSTIGPFVTSVHQ